MTSCGSSGKELPYLGVHEYKDTILNGQRLTDTLYYQIPAFELMNQDSALVTEQQLNNKVYVAYFFFTSCPATCPIMTRAMDRVYQSVGQDPAFHVIAHTIDPKRDTPEKLKSFALDNGVYHSNWDFLTGTTEYIYELGMNGYYLSMGQHDEAPGGFIHSSRFILVDRNRHIRGMYEGTDAGEVTKMIRDIKGMLKG